MISITQPVQFPCHSWVLFSRCSDPIPKSVVPKLEDLRQVFLFLCGQADDKADSDLTLDQVATDLTPEAQFMSVFCFGGLLPCGRKLTIELPGESAVSIGGFAGIWFLAPNISKRFTNDKTDSANGSKLLTQNWRLESVIPKCYPNDHSLRVFLNQHDFISLMMLKPSQSASKKSENVSTTNLK